MQHSRTLKSIFAIAILVITLFTFCGCDVLLQYLGMNDVITITAEYVGEPICVGCTLQNADVKVVATFVHGITGEEQTYQVYNFQVSTLDTSTVGEKTVQVAYTEGNVTATTDLKISVVKKPLPVSISATYNGGDLAINGTLNKSDFAVDVVYDNNTTLPADDFALSSIDTSTKGEKLVTITYSYLDGTTQKSLQTTVKVSVVATLSGISASFVGEPLEVDATFSADNLLVQEVYTDGSKVTIDSSNYSFVDVDTSTAGIKTATVSYNKNAQTYTATLNVIVVDKIANPLQLIGIFAEFTNKNFHVGDTLTINDFKVTATYNYIGDDVEIDDLTTTITDFSISQTTFETEGKATVTISYTYNGETQTCEVAIDVLEKLPTLTEITVEADVVIFPLGDTITNADIIVTAHFSDGTSCIVSGFVITDPADGVLSTSGEVEVELSYTYNNVTCTTKVIVSVMDTTEEANYGKYGILSADEKSVKITDTAKVVDTTDLQIHFLELGNQYTGDCTYIKAGDTDILIDAGSKRDSASTIANYISKYCTDGVLEYVIATHAHEDHIAGFVGNVTWSGGSPSTDYQNGLFDLYECKNIIDFSGYNTTSQVSKDYLRKRDKLVENGTSHYTALECWNNNNGSDLPNQSVTDTGARRYIKLSDNVEMEILYTKFYKNKASSGENNNSVCLMINQYGANYDFDHPDNPENENNVNHFLFTGDLEKTGEESLVASNSLPEVVLFKGGHHGSQTSSNEVLLNVIKPKVVCICCCTGSDEYAKNNPTVENIFPSQSTIDRLAKHTDLVFATSLFNSSLGKGSVPYSLNGNITLTCNHLGVNLTASNNVTMLKDTEWFKKNRTCPSEWQ